MMSGMACSAATTAAATAGDANAKVGSTIGAQQLD